MGSEATDGWDFANKYNVDCKDGVYRVVHKETGFQVGTIQSTNKKLQKLYMEMSFKITEDNEQKNVLSK